MSSNTTEVYSALRNAFPSNPHIHIPSGYTVKKPRSKKKNMVVELTQEDINKLSYKQKIMTEILLKPDYVLKRDSTSGTVFFWFDKMIALNLKTGSFVYLCEWKNSVAITNGYELPATIKPLSEKFSPGHSKEVEDAYIDYITEKLLLKTDPNES